MTHPTVTPRRPGEPEPEPLGILLAHRAMLRDLDRLAALAAGLAATGRPVGRKRAVAIAAYLNDFCTSIHHHHRAEDDVLWPVLEASAGAHVDLAELSDDHSALDPKLHRVRAGAAALCDGGVVSPALAADLADLRDTLTEHIADEEKSIIPIIRQYVSVTDWKAVEAAVQKQGGKISFEAPRVIAVATPAEMAVITAELPTALKIIIKLVPVPFRRRERLVFGG